VNFARFPADKGCTYSAIGDTLNTSGQGDTEIQGEFRVAGFDLHILGTDLFSRCILFVQLLDFLIKQEAFSPPLSGEG
jgi:hypothetical protein